jgi:ABC-type transport system involved in cytochrome bd biosynthesis fused ATPase/permease subunit
MMRLLLGGAAACIVVAVVIALVTTAELAIAIAITLGGTAFVLLISAAFYAVGRSEDRDRARDAGQR